MLINSSVTQIKSRRWSHCTITVCMMWWNSKIMHIFDSVLYWIWATSSHVQVFFIILFLSYLVTHTRTMPLGTILEMSMYSLISAHISLYCMLSPPGGISSSYWCSDALLHNLCSLTFNWFSKLQPANSGFWNRHILLKWSDVRDITEDLTCYNMCKHTCWGQVTH